MRSLEELVTAVASRLSAAYAETWVTVAEQVLRDLVDHFELDACLLRRNDHVIGATILVAEWPKRQVIPDPDPLGVVYFADAEPEFAQAANLKEVGFVRPGQDNSEYQERVARGAGVPQVTLAAVPLVSGDVTTGTLGFIKYGDHSWTAAEVNVLKAIASLLTQVQERVRAEEQLRYSADHDELTGLVNRRFLAEYLEHRIAPGMPGPVAILFLDLDRLKSVNDFLGHTAGDAFIMAVGARLKDHLGQEDVVARLGGDEFVVVFGRELDLAAAQIMATGIMDIVSERVAIGSVFVTRSASIGVTVGIPGQCSSADLLRQADQALLAAKSRGGNGIAAFTEEIRAESESRDIVELSLRSSISDDCLHLVYQPEVDMRSGVIVAVEALLRWEHPLLGLLMPESFIHVAESTNLATELGTWVIRSAFRQYAQWWSEIAGLDVVLRVNVSPGQLVGADFVDSIARELGEYGIDGGNVCLEITENAVVSDVDRTRRALRGLAGLGVQVAIDDFGSGYSSLAQLKQLQFDVLKIDREFIRDLGDSPADLAIVKSIVTLAKSFDLILVAEGVETEMAARTLLDLGCYRAQGFLLHRPLPADMVRDLLITNRETPGPS
ncbi:putative bifunctional diguanylate cyclase/phosphodiesterase [Rhodococcus spelaei]|uniref:putative bifunctional diguanylate cyclase/phosphodiesterase n=1 Tax=Rhodococcus spelaei TaxID=2546320 RepID=UPI001FE6CC98|nr:bifunctional diguanylate cyclase/phosphodiesterase [Rhodococcus spelaei]